MHRVADELPHPEKDGCALEAADCPCRGMEENREKAKEQDANRDDEYGGPLENRARFALEVVRAVRAEVGGDFFVGFKISIREHLDEVLPWLDEGNSRDESLQVCKWLEEAGVDCIHVSTGGEFPHPRNPAGDFPSAIKWYEKAATAGWSRGLHRNLPLPRRGRSVPS